MLVATWNVNSINARRDSIEYFIQKVNPDVLCLQETKITDQSFPLEWVISLGYSNSVFKGQKSYNGVAILSKIPIEDHFFLEIYNSDARHVSARINGINITNIYVPAGGEIANEDINPKFKNKIEFIKYLEQWFIKHLSIFGNHFLLGDFNIAPHRNDVWSSRALQNVVSHTDMERNLLMKFKENTGFIDIFRDYADEEEKIYSWWSYRNKNWKKNNKGRRLDHIWCTPDIYKKVICHKIMHFTRELPNPSDHTPCVVEIIIPSICP